MVHPHPYAKMNVHTHPSRGSKTWVTKSLKLQLAALGILILENEKNVWKMSRLWDGLSEKKGAAKVQERKNKDVNVHFFFLNKNSINVFRQ